MKGEFLDNKRKGIFFVLLFAVLFIFIISSISAAYSTSSPRWTQSKYGIGSISQSTGVEREFCDAGQDFVLQIAPFGCDPLVVRSDLLEEQATPVFCQIVATKINPLISVDAINRVEITADYPKGVRDVGFHPQRVALGYNNTQALTTPVANNIGYAVIVLDQQKNASAMPDYVQGNLTANIKYDLKNAFGVGNVELHLPLMDDSQWDDQKVQYGFWNGRAYLRATEISVDRARISVQTDKRELASFVLEEGQTSNKVFLPGFDCLAGFRLKLDDLEVPSRRAKLNINGEIVQVSVKENFLDGKCKAIEVEKQGIVESIKVSCKEDEQTTQFDLVISPSVKLSIDGIEKEYQVGDRLYAGAGKTVYLGYVGSEQNSKNQEKLFIYTFAMPFDQNKLTGEEMKAISTIVDGYEYQDTKGTPLVDFLASAGRNLVVLFKNSYDYIVDGNSYNKIGYGEDDDVEGKQVKVLGYKDVYDQTLDSRILELFEKASADYNTIIAGYADTKYPQDSRITKGEESLKELIDLNIQTKQKRTAAELCDELKRDYPNSKALADFKEACENPLLFSNPEKVTQHVTVNGRVKEISFQGVYDPSSNDYGAEFIITGPNGVRKTAKLGYDKTFYLEGMRNVNGEGSYSIKIVPDQVFPVPEKRTAADRIYPDNSGDSPENIYFRYHGYSPPLSDSWQWSFDKQNWMDVSEKVANGGRFDNLPALMDDYKVLDLLEGKNISKGAEILFDFKKKVSEQITDVVGKTSCEQCGGGALDADVCTENECKAISDKIGKTCAYVSDKYWVFGLYFPYPFGNCYGPNTIVPSKKPVGEYVRLLDIQEESVQVRVNFITQDSLLESVGNFVFTTNTPTIKLGQTIDVGEGYKIGLVKVNLKRVAKVSINAGINNAGTNATFPFKINIEKRGIQLTPDEARKKIEILNKTMAEFQDKSDKLGKVVKVMKTACIGTSLALMAINFLENKDGKAIARKEVMRGDNGWYEKCTEMVNGKQYGSVDECLYKNSDAIEKDVNAWNGFQSSLNDDIKQIQSNCDKRNFLGENVINDTCFLNQYVNSDYKTRMKQCLTRLDKDGDGEVIIQDDKINLNKFVDELDTKKVSIEEFRQLELYCRVKGATSLNIMAESRLNASLKDIFENTRASSEVNSVMNDLKSIGKGGLGVSWDVSKDAIQGAYNGATITSDDVIGGQDYFVNGVPYKSVIQGYGTSTYLFILDGNGDKFGVKKVFKYDGVDVASKKIKISEITNGTSEDDISRKFEYKKYDYSSYQNPYLSSSGTSYPIVRYYDTAPNKGLPAVVPFDLDNGWYVSIKNTLPSFGAIRSYDESGMVRSFYLCNVGPNRIEENRGGDDICEMVNKGTGMPYNQFNGLDPTLAEELVRKADAAVEAASRAYASGDTITINGRRIRIGEPATEIPDIQCQDFMSPTSCRIMFNVCDPVICPSSRCDLGGAYPVRDVVQSGIVGSIALCLPNFPEVYVPVCLTGVKAGLDGWISVHKSYAQCLQQSIDTGETVGICDEIYSVYKCEFFWRQAAPFAKLAAPKALEIIFGQNTRGGGEYLGVQTALDNAENSVNFFTQYYADNTFKAFKARATENIGGEVCKAYASGVFPSGGSVLDVLTEPDSPTQFYGKFDEIPYTTVTNPPQSQYKVFYHIYSGNDRGSYFKVYFKGESDPYYRDAGLTRNLASGYIAKGDFKTDTPDFIGPSGYKQLCIMVNDQESCGFKEVTTDFGLNYLSEKFVGEEAKKRDIKSETACVAGSRNLYSLANPNLEEGASSALNPAIYNQGLIRICATKDPGEGTDPYAGGEKARWIDVGYCDDPKMRCWLDGYSVKDIIKNTNIESDVLSEQEKAYGEALADGPEYVEDFEAAMSNISSESNAAKRINLLSDLIRKVFWNYQKGQIYFQRGNEYKALALGNYQSINEKPEEDEGETQEVEHGYTSPVYEFDDGAIMVTNLFYKFLNGRWYWSGDGVNWLSNMDQIVGNLGGVVTKEGDISSKNKNFVRAILQDTSYTGGLKLLIDRTRANDEGGWFYNSVLKTQSVEMTKDPIFKVSYQNNVMYLRFAASPQDQPKKWWFSYNEENDWRTEIPPGMIPEFYVLFNKVMSGDNDFYGGAKIIFEVDASISSGGVSCSSAPITCSGGQVAVCGGNDRQTCTGEIPSCISAPIICPDGQSPICQNNEQTCTGVEEDKGVFQPRDVSEVTEIVNKGISKRILASSCAKYSEFLVEASNKYELPDPLLLVSLIQQESSCDYSDISYDGSSFGLLQINTAFKRADNGKDIGHCGDYGLPSDRSQCRDLLLKNYELNIAVGVQILKKNYITYVGGSTQDDIYSRGVRNNCGDPNYRNKFLAYTGWDRALRTYNGFGCSDSRQISYVDTIMDRYDQLAALT